jgi:hypothetical protein
MKYFAALSFLFLAGCSHTTSTNTIPAFQQGGEYYMSPGTFTGTWLSGNITNGNAFTIDTDSCTAVITEADSLLVGTITNDSNKEVLTISGYHLGPPYDSPSPHYYTVLSIGSLGDTNSGVVYFSLATDTLRYSPYSMAVYEPRWLINCVRR